jgi:hypothetical protein
MAGGANAATVSVRGLGWGWVGAVVDLTRARLEVEAAGLRAAGFGDIGANLAGYPIATSQSRWRRAARTVRPTTWS